MRREADLTLVVACSLGLAIIILTSPFGEPSRVVLGLPTLLFVPGYALQAALFPRKDNLDALERLVLSFGLSLAVLAVTALILNYSPWGVRLSPILAFITVFILLAAAAAFVRRRMFAGDEAVKATVDVRSPRWPRVRLAETLVSVGMLFALVALGATAYFVATSRARSESFTEFYVLGPEAKAEGYPRQLKVGDQATVILGVANHEGRPTTIRIVTKIDGKTVDDIDYLVLADGGRWEGTRTLAPNHPGDDQKVEFLLYEYGESEPYRSLHLWLTVKPMEVERALVEALPRPEPVVLPGSAPASEEEAPAPEPIPPPQPTPAPAEPPTVHIVVAGENLTRIARDYGLTLGALLAVNEIENPNLIYPNQPIRLPPSAGEGENQ